MTMTTMRRPILLGLLLLAGTACTTPPPRVPFQYGDGWHVAAIAGGRAMDDRYFNGQPFMGLWATLPDGMSRNGRSMDWRIVMAS